ncbi:interleukin-25 [Ochotona princeps]|uniref:interleukin-25 n=1 Tax=Ochotona princeps TaxID=9978 RepID=UPI002715536F|nr:interleukin-25 [Ochotona princeps]
MGDSLPRQEGGARRAGASLRERIQRRAICAGPVASRDLWPPPGPPQLVDLDFPDSLGPQAPSQGRRGGRSWAVLDVSPGRSGQPRGLAEAAEAVGPAERVWRPSPPVRPQDTPGERCSRDCDRGGRAHSSRPTWGGMTRVSLQIGPRAQSPELAPTLGSAVAAHMHPWQGPSGELQVPLGRRERPRLGDDTPSLIALFVVAFLAMAMGTHTLSQAHHWPTCCSSQGQLPKEWLQWSPVPLPVLEPASASTPFSEESCRASEDGPLNSRAISPWRYELDRDLNRLPQDLYHARCLCPHCVSLQTGSDMDPLGNSELLYHNQTVFYRRPCPREHGAPRGYCLERRLYRVSLACVCVRPRVMA